MILMHDQHFSRLRQRLQERILIQRIEYAQIDDSISAPVSA